MQKTLALAALGNAIVDVLSECDDAFLERHAIQKGSMSLVDAARSQSLYEAMGQAKQVSGGSAANTIAGFASFGGSCGYMGKVAADQLGSFFAHDMKAANIRYTTKPLHNGPETARCMIFVTPDAQRSMNTYLGASVEFDADDIDETLIHAAQILYLEGYLFDRAAAKAAYRKASGIARAASTKVALTLSDKFCVDRHRADFLNLLENDVDILFANEAEILALFETEHFDEAVNKARAACDLVVVTRSEKGAVIATQDDMMVIHAHPVARVVDTTGAGDQFAAGFLFGLTHNASLYDCGRLGALAAAEVISHMGPRPETSLKQLAASELGLNLNTAHAA